MPARRTPASGPPTADPPRDAVAAFAVRLHDLDAELHAIYDRLGFLADELDGDAAVEDRDPDWFGSMPRRIAFDNIRSSVLAARHQIHGGIIEIVRVRPQADPARRPV